MRLGTYAILFAAATLVGCTARNHCDDGCCHSGGCTSQGCDGYVCEGGTGHAHDHPVVAPDAGSTREPGGGAESVPDAATDDAPVDLPTTE